MLLLAHRKSRATIFTDTGWKAAFLVLVLIYLGYIADNATSFGGDPALYAAFENAAHVLFGAFLLWLAVHLHRYASRGAGLVIDTM